ncbi:MAG: DUF1330 domain-containing protein [Acidimicrobiia bacterium]
MSHSTSGSSLGTVGDAHTGGKMPAMADSSTHGVPAAPSTAPARVASGPAGYLIAEIEVSDPELYADYIPLAGVTVAAHGGRFIVRGGETVDLEGNAPKRFVVIEFPSLERARTWYDSAEYQEAAAIRQAASTGRLFLVEGAQPYA